MWLLVQSLTLGKIGPKIFQIDMQRPRAEVSNKEESFEISFKILKFEALNFSEIGQNAL